MVGFSGECGRRDGGGMNGPVFAGIQTLKVGNEPISAVIDEEATPALMERFEREMGRVFVLSGVSWHRDNKQVLAHFTPGNGIIKIINNCGEYVEQEESNDDMD